MLVSINGNSEKEDGEVWEKFQSLPVEKQNFLCSEKTASVIKGLISKFNLSIEDAASISRVIKLFFLGYIQENVIENELKLRIPNLGSNVLCVRDILRKEIIYSNPREHNDEIEGSFDKKNESNKIKIPIYQALQQYPHLGEQAITSSPIKLKIFPQPVRPSIKNWIEDYRQVMGAQRHGMMERGNYLFHSENGKRITPGERKKLAEVLRSLDEDVALKIDPERQEIFFEINQGEKARISPSQENKSSHFQPKANSDWEERIKSPVLQKEVKIPNFMAEKARTNSPSFSKATDFFQPEKIMPESPNPIPSAARKSFSASYQANAGKPWEEIREEEKVSFSSPQVLSSEKNNSGQNRISSPTLSDNGPKIKGNTVDLRN